MHGLVLCMFTCTCATCVVSSCLLVGCIHVLQEERDAADTWIQTL